mmetsp:Transcript_10515/g.32359  ORF Transcript_10515/g.32359 Transcript_10515/m.32359 type:complete len:96 (+) Transcript_10515:1086-1373(+)
MAAYKWTQVYMSPWPHLSWAATRLVSMTCSASGCEHAWSVEGWIHSKKRNRMGQTTVDRLVRTHTNLLLESKLQDWTCAVLPWDLDMIIEEPDDE